MTIDYRVLIGQTLNANDQKIISEILIDTFDEVNFTYNKWNPHSELSKLNRLKAYEIVKISTQLEKLFKLTHEIVLFTEGRFDPTIESLQTLWKQHLETGAEPVSDAILALKPTLGWNKVHIENGLFFKEHDLTTIDLGGIAKGYCVDLLVERLNAAGFLNVFVEWGGGNQS